MGKGLAHDEEEIRGEGAPLSNTPLHYKAIIRTPI